MKIIKKIIKRIISRIEDFYYQFKWGFQRLYRGWDDRMMWGIENWMIDNIPDILKKILEIDDYPSGIFYNPEELYDEDWKPIYLENAKNKRRDIFNEVIHGFELMNQIEDGNFKTIEEYKEIERQSKEKLKLIIEYWWGFGD